MLTSIPFDIETIVEDAGLVVTTGMGPTRGKFRVVLAVSKHDIPPKNDVHTGIFTLGELTGVKIGANVAEEYKTEVKIGELTVQTVGGKDTLGKVTIAVDNLVAEEFA